MNSQASPASPTISRIRTPNTRGGIDFHFDWGVSHFLSKQVFVGFVGYAYQQITDDFGQPAVLGGFRSRVLGIGPAARLYLPGGRYAGVSGREGLWRIRCRQPAFGLEHLVDVRDLGGRAESGDANQAHHEIGYARRCPRSHTPNAITTAPATANQVMAYCR